MLGEFDSNEVQLATHLAQRIHRLSLRPQHLALDSSRATG